MLDTLEKDRNRVLYLNYRTKGISRSKSIVPEIDERNTIQGKEATRIRKIAKILAIIANKVNNLNTEITLGEQGLTEGKNDINKTQSSLAFDRHLQLSGIKKVYHASYNSGIKAELIKDDVIDLSTMFDDLNKIHLYRTKLIENPEYTKEKDLYNVLTTHFAGNPVISK